jgi:hypothetical protein
MKRVELKLKQASAVLGVPTKDLQNLVQFKVLRPRLRDNLYWFDANLLLKAKIAFYLRDALGTSSAMLGRFTEAMAGCLKAGVTTRSQYVSLRSRPATGNDPVEVKIPLRSLAKDLDEQLLLASNYRDLPRGRKRPGWKREMLESMRAAASDLPDDLSDAQIMKTIRQYRAERRKLPEISVAFQKKKTA